jgi:hypothetical protein
MSETSVIAILAAVGIILTGTVSADAKAFALAIQNTEQDALVQFVREYPESQFAPDALLLAAIDNVGRLHDSAVSEDNDALTCELWIDRVDDNYAIVRWSIRGAETVSIYPLGIDGTAPADGEKKVSLDSQLRVLLRAHDAAGNEVSCWVSLGSTTGINIPTDHYVPPAASV